MGCDFTGALTTPPGPPAIHYSGREVRGRVEVLPKFLPVPAVMTLQRQEEAELFRKILSSPNAQRWNQRIIKVGKKNLQDHQVQPLKICKIYMVLVPIKRTFCSLSKIIRTALLGQKSAAWHRKNLFPFVLEQAVQKEWSDINKERHSG